ncbi:MAG: hypothetical protein RIC19_22405 [Phaeodactylibacter sp.]|uniref:hypothetical protein n=1 Tax=Phaeodactylibacter sp. TaxID=1940289 RepID=UPI0032EB7399
MTQRLTLFAALVATLLLTSCQDFDDLSNIDSANYDAAYALPIVQSRLSIRDALESTGDLAALYIDDEGVIHFEYRGDIIAQNSDTLFARINESLNGQLIPLIAQRIGLPLKTAEGAEFDRLKIKQGQLVWAFQNAHPEPVTVTLTFPDLYKDGVPLQLTGSTAGYDGEGALLTYSNLFNPYNLAGTEIVTAEGTDSIYVEYELIREGGQEDTVAFGGITLSDLAFSYMEGYFGTEVQAGGRDTIIIDFFDDWVKGDIYFADPTVTFRVENSFGIPTRSRVNLFNVFTVRDETLPLEGELIDNGIDFVYPGLDEVGETFVERYVFNKDNSNIDEILGAGPLAIDYDVDAITHPDSNRSIRGFLTDSSYYQVDVEVDLPLYGNAIDFLAQDTLALSLGELGQEVYKAEFKMVTQNELPLNVSIQGYFLDEQGMVLDSLFQGEQLIMEGAAADDNGISTEVAEKITFIDYPEERFARIRPSASINIVATFTTTGEGAQNVKLLAEQGVDVKIGAIFGRRSE